MIKIYKLPVIVVLFVLCAASCSDEGSGRLLGQHPITFTASVGGEKNTPVSRAYSSTWTVGDKVGIHKTVSGSLGDEGFVRHTIQSDLETLTPDNTDETFYYPVNGSDVRFIAFYPYPEETTISEGNTVTFELTDQSTREKQETIDFLYYKDDTKLYNSSTYAADLDFDHKLSRIVLNITNKDSGEGEPAAITLSINGFPTTVVCSLVDGSAAAGTEAGIIIPWQSQDTDTGKTYEAIVAPHEATGTFADRLFTITVGTSTFYYKPNQTLEPGYSYIYNFTVSGVIVDFEGITITDWNHVTEDEEGLHTLSISDGERTFLRDAATHTLGIKTNNSSIPTVTSSEDWLTIESVEGVNGIYTANYTVAENTLGTRTATITVTEGTITRTCIVLQRPYLRINTVASANCIVLQTRGEAVRIPISIVNEPATYPGISDGRDTYAKPFEDESNVRFDAKVLWVDSPNFEDVSLQATDPTQIIGEVDVIQSSLEESYLIVSPGVKPGNAVVCITKPGTDEIIWSWHIWVLSSEDRATMWIKGSSENTTYPNKPAATANGFAFFPLNLGAFNAKGATTEWTSTDGWAGHPFAGLYYQWGRKEPLTNRAQPSWIGTGLNDFDLSNINNISEFMSIRSDSYNGLNAIKHPTVFINHFSNVGGWTGIIHLYNYSINNSWGHCITYGYNGKSPFDPCPAGWRIPPVRTGTPPSPNTIPHPEADLDNVWVGIQEEGAALVSANDSPYGISGYHFTNYGGFYPFLGYNNSVSNYSGENIGGYWGAGIYDSNSASSYLSIRNNGAISYIGSTSCFEGRSVRCVTE